MSDSGSQQPRPAYCEEYSEEAEAPIPETRQSAHVAANLLRPPFSKSMRSGDEQSDSGYSSHTHSAPNSSLDSKVEANLAVSCKTPPAGGEKPAKAIAQKNAPFPPAHSPEKNVLRRTESRGRKYGDARKRDCRCDKCIDAARRNTDQLGSFQPPQYTIAQPSQKMPAPSSSQARRPPLQPEAMMVPREHVRPRPMVSRPRPMSFHAGMMPEHVYPNQPTYVLEGQQPMRSTAYPYMAPQMLPQPTFYEPMEPMLVPQPQQAPSHPAYQEYYPPMQIAYEAPPRPRPRRPQNEQYRSRPQSMYYGNPPISEYDEPVYTMVESSQPLERQISRRSRRESLRSSEHKVETDKQMMPPPSLPKLDTRGRQDRPPMRHAATSATPYSHSQSVQDRRESNQIMSGSPIKTRDSRKGSLEEQPRSRRSSIARPRKTSDDKVVSFDEVERDMSKLDLARSLSNSKKRSSVHGRESLEDLEESIEAYQQSKGTIRSPATGPSHEDLMSRLVRKKTATDSDAGSRVSANSRGTKASREGSDNKYAGSTKALDHRSSKEASARNENDRFSLRFNPEDTNIKMQGGIDGGAMNLRKSKDGDGNMELSFESRQSLESGRGRMGSISNGSRPPLREKSRKRYSFIEGRGVQEISEPGFDASRSIGMARIQSSQDEDGARIVGERIITTTRSRRSSRYGYDGRERYEQ